MRPFRLGWDDIKKDLIGLYSFIPLQLTTKGRNEDVNRIEFYKEYLTQSLLYNDFGVRHSKDLRLRKKMK